MEKIKLGDVLKYEQPTKYIVKSTRYNNDFEIPVLTAGQSFILGYTDEKENIYQDLPVIIFDDFTTATKYVDFPFKVKSSAMKILKAESGKSDIRYLYYLLQTVKLNSEQHKRYWISKYAELNLSVPILKEQKRISSILDEADKVRQLNKQLIKKYDELKQSLFLEMFGDPVANSKDWDKVEFNELCSFEKESIKPENITSGTFYVGLESIEKETGKISDKVTVEANELKSNKFYFNKDYILYGKLRPYLNKVGNPDFEGICSTDIIPLKPLKGKTNKSFITSIMRSSGFVSWANERCSGANLPRISPKEVQKYLIINPPIQLQNQFAERVQMIKQQKQQTQDAIQKSEDLFNSLLQKAFKGELV